MTVQFLERDGKREFAVLPYEEYLELISGSSAVKDTLPNEVIGLSLKEDISLLKALRKHLRMTQVELAEKAGVTQAAVSQMEKAEKPHKATVKKLAVAMGVVPDFFFD